jgi:hypothetical protein
MVRDSHRLQLANWDLQTKNMRNFEGLHESYFR